MIRLNGSLSSHLLAFAAAISLAGWACAHAQSQSRQGLAAAPARPNIVFIMTDQQHAGMLGCAGNPHLRTPALDRLAAAGVRFERAYACNPVCVPSRFSLQTGRMPSAIGMRSNEGRLPVDRQLCEQSLGPLLRAAGYHCVYGGKDHLPAQMSQFVMSQGYEKLTADARDDLAEACVRFLRQSHDRPFLLFASFINPHDVCYMAINDFARSQGRPVAGNVDSRHCEQVLERARRGGDLSAFIREHCPPLPANLDIPAGEPEGITLDYVDPVPFRRYARQQWSGEMWRLHRWLYARLTEEVDGQIGRVLEALREAGLEEKTLVIFTSDHGDMDSAHRLEHKSVLYEESVRIPLVLAWKGVIASGRVDREHLVSNGLDLLPTICDYAGVPAPAGLPGRSLRPLLERTEGAGWRDHIVVESQNGRMVRTERYKYCVYEHGQRREMLIDIEKDPGEMKNLADAAERAEELNRHRRLLGEWVARIDDRLGRGYLIQPSP